MSHPALYIRNVNPGPFPSGLSSVGLTSNNLYSAQANAMQQIGSPLGYVGNSANNQGQPGNQKGPVGPSPTIILPAPPEKKRKKYAALKSYLITTAGVVSGIFLALAIPTLIFRQAFSKPVFGGFREGYRQLIIASKYVLNVGKICRDENMAENVRGLVRTMREFNENNGPENLRELNRNAAKLNRFSKKLEAGGFFGAENANSLTRLLPQVSQMTTNMQNSWAGWFLGLRR